MKLVDKMWCGGGVLGVLALITVVGAAAYGWVMNIVQLCGMSFDVITVELVARIIGIFMAPLGAVMGYL